jgi:hypothetical protein
MGLLKRLFGMCLILFGMLLDGYGVYAVFTADCSCGCCNGAVLESSAIRPAFLTYKMSLAADPGICELIGCSAPIRPIYIDALAGGTAMIAMGTLLKRRGKVFDPTPMRIAH